VGRPLGDVAADMRAALSQLSMPPGYSYALRGSVQIFNQALTALGAALVLAIVLEYMLLVALYESWILPFVRMLTVPLGLLGGVVLLWITGNTINIFSIIGMIMGEGLVAKSGILLIDYTNTMRERGMSRTEALQEAVRVRLRPILMTSATMIFGMLPLALKLEPGAETRAPMAIVVIGALVSSTFLTLVIVPALYSIIDDLRSRVFGAKRPKAWEGATAPQPPGHGAVVAAAQGAQGPHGPHAVANGSHVAEHGSHGVPLNIVDHGNAYVVRAALPGIKQEDVEVSIHAHTLTIRGQRRGGDDGHTDGSYVVQEHPTGRWERSMVLPHEVESAGVTASYEDGILELRLPKAGPTATRTVPINGHSADGPPT
jgi:HSP20 family molecular chaperone IbpA